MPSQPPIDRQCLVQRHNVVQKSMDPRSPVSVGNGEFAFTMDLTGLQSFPEAYPVGDDDAPGTLLGTQAQWGWHSIPPARSYALDEAIVRYNTPAGAVPYVDMAGSTAEAAAGENWLRANPHRLDLGRIGFSLGHSGGSRPFTPDDIGHPEQTLDLWTGVVHSSFTLGPSRVDVTTACHPEMDQLGIKVCSDAVRNGLGITIAFPYGSQMWHNAADWDAADKHRTVIEADDAGWIVRRDLDGSGYLVRIVGNDLDLETTGRHEFRLTSHGEVLEATVHFISTGNGECTTQEKHSHASRQSIRNPAPAAAPETLDTTGRVADAVVSASTASWQRFWTSGGAIQLHHTPDPRAQELERRIVLSQYLTAVNCSGSMPPQETGLMCNSWRGRFHLEMHWWHSAHFAQWNRPQLLLQSLRWYHQAMDAARETAAHQGYDGVRWPKQVGPDARESPSHIGPFLIWQQPHPIYLAELLFRADPSHHVLEEFADIVEQSARFMADYAHHTADGYGLGPPLVPAQESYASIRAEATNPTFELAYWQWALRTASRWRERLGLDPVPDWETVAAGMVRPKVRDGVYTAIHVAPYTIREDHPSMLCALGFLPRTDLIDPDIMRATLNDVMRHWDWESTWGWDYPVMAMTAARLNEPELAVDALLTDTKKNTILTNGHNRQTSSLPLYLPGNGGLLAAAALMAAGWDDGPERNAPGFPQNWSVQQEGLVRAP